MLSLSGFTHTRLYVGKAPRKWANKLMPKFTNGASKNTQTKPLINSSTKQKISSLPKSFEPFQKLTKQIAALPTRKIPANSIEAVVLLLTITPAKLFIANNNQTTRLNTLGAYVPFNICFKPTA